MDSLTSFSVTEEVTIAAWDTVDAKWDEIPRSYTPSWHTFMALQTVLFQIQDIVQGHLGEVDLSQLPGHATKWINGVSRFIRKYDSSVWGHYGLDTFQAFFSRRLCRRQSVRRLLRFVSLVPLVTHASLSTNPSVKTPN